MSYAPAEDRYERMAYNRCGRAACSCRRSRSASGTASAATVHSETSRAIIRRAFDAGITHFDLANNYGPPCSSAEETFGRLLRRDHSSLPRRAGRRRRPATTCGRARTGVGLAQVPPGQPRQSLGASGSTTSTSSTRTLRPRDAARGDDWRLDSAVRQGKALYVGISSYSARETVKAAAILHSLGTPPRPAPRTRS